MGCLESLENTREAEIRGAEANLKFQNYSLAELLGSFFNRN